MNASKQLLTAVLLVASAAVSVAPGQHALRPSMDPPDVRIDAPAGQQAFRPCRVVYIFVARWAGAERHHDEICFSRPQPQAAPAAA